MSDRKRELAKCSPRDAADILDIVHNPKPISEEAKAVHAAGLAIFEANFVIKGPDDG